MERLVDSCPPARRAHPPCARTFALLVAHDHCRFRFLCRTHDSTTITSCRSITKPCPKAQATIRLCGKHVKHLRRIRAKILTGDARALTITQEMAWLWELIHYTGAGRGGSWGIGHMAAMPGKPSAADAEAFLTHLAMLEKVSASTQNQAWRGQSTLLGRGNGELALVGCWTLRVGCSILDARCLTRGRAMPSAGLVRGSAFGRSDVHSFFCSSSLPTASVEAEKARRCAAGRTATECRSA